MPSSMTARTPTIDILLMEELLLNGCERQLASPWQSNASAGSQRLLHATGMGNFPSGPY
jgi:hypothetical protein